LIVSDGAALFRAKARTFWFAACFLPGDRRAAVGALYLLARTLDDLVDEPPAGRSPDDVRRELRAWRRWIESAYRDPPPQPEVGALAGPALSRHGVPPEYLLLLLDGVASDLGTAPMPTWRELRRYCFRVASSVGLAMCHILGAGDDGATLSAAAELGVAMQLTNILRDVGADLRLGRIYLPQADMADHGYSSARLRRLAGRAEVAGRAALDDDFRALMGGQIGRARAHYQRGLAGVWRLPASGRLSILLAGRLYRCILDAIESADYDVFSRRARTTRLQKGAMLARCWVRLRLGPGGGPPAADPPPTFRLSDWATP
jgi:15-cis-phytoene synthase